MHKTERVSNEIIEYSIFSITYCTIVRSTENEFRFNHHIYRNNVTDYQNMAQQARLMDAEHGYVH
ncbi:hypothetical protein MNBD_GAMMA11-1427 [hydrothermal vent metagenome]|uniref:Uncharacterized protein n=1 Tax=hydrothermal vent metagenome TaxID=652676 RepID=A0A3B0XNM5_9ZZZZ